MQRFLPCRMKTFSQSFRHKKYHSRHGKTSLNTGVKSDIPFWFESPIEKFPCVFKTQDAWQKSIWKMRIKSVDGISLFYSHLNCAQPSTNARITASFFSAAQGNIIIMTNFEAKTSVCKVAYFAMISNGLKWTNTLWMVSSKLEMFQS